MCIPYILQEIICYFNTNQHLLSIQILFDFFNQTFVLLLQFLKRPKNSCWNGMNCTKPQSSWQKISKCLSLKCKKSPQTNATKPIIWVILFFNIIADNLSHIIMCMYVKVVHTYRVSHMDSYKSKRVL